MKEFIRKADVILLIVLLALGLAASAVLAVHGGASASDARVIIKSGGSLYASYPLSEKQTVVVPAPQSESGFAASEQSAADASEPGSAISETVQGDLYNVVIIDSGSVSVSEASCKNQVCVRHGSISHPGESIVCLPNRLIVSIEGGEGGGYDSITS